MAQRSLPVGDGHFPLDVVTAWIDRAVRRLRYAGSGICVVDGEVRCLRSHAK
jgi:hypothetical protein